MSASTEQIKKLREMTGAGILELLLRLNQERGLTMVLVTHDPRVAAQAGRIVQLYDGLIESDGAPEGSPAPTAGRAGGAA